MAQHFMRTWLKWRNYKVQKSFVLDLNKCTGCGACQLACSIENELEPQISWRHISTFNENHYPTIPTYHLSFACNHCVDPPCLRYCPANAFSKNVETGAVTIDSQKCIGCKYCSWICPYDAPQFNYASGLMEKCTFCEHRLKEGMEPACVALCPAAALHFDDYKENSIDSISGFTKTKIQPAIQFLQGQDIEKIPEFTGNDFDKSDITIDSIGSFETKVNLKTEWSLVIFTILSAIIVGWFTSAVIFRKEITPLVFFSLGISGMLFSIFHLGKKNRAYQAILNWKHSWLSREIIFLTIFLIFSAIFLFKFESQNLICWFGILFGFLALFSMDQVYQNTTTANLSFHSARTVFTAILFIGLLSTSLEFFVGILFAKLLLYANQKVFQNNSLTKSKLFLTINRILIGFFFPVIFLTFDFQNSFLFVLISLIIGETIDRCEFYLSLKIPTPKNQIFEDLVEEIKKSK